MKKVFLILVLLSIHISTCFAQDWYEVVYLKDGSIIKGLIVKQKPNAYIRIQDLEGNITIIDYLQIDKITKEHVTEDEKAKVTGVVSKMNTSYSEKKDAPVSNGELRGKRYRGIFDVSVSPGNDGVYYKFNSIVYEGTISHGYQLNPYFFFGTGLGVHHYDFDHFESITTVTIFENFRANFTDTKISPYFDAKIGFAVTGMDGIYFSPSLGIRFGTSGNFGINIQVGYSMQGYKYISNGLDVEKAYNHSINCTLGIDW